MQVFAKFARGASGDLGSVVPVSAFAFGKNSGALGGRRTSVLVTALTSARSRKLQGALHVPLSGKFPKALALPAGERRSATRARAREVVTLVDRGPELNKICLESGKRQVLPRYLLFKGLLYLLNRTRGLW